MTHKKHKAKIYNVDFDAIERRNYRSLNSFQKEIVDKMIENGKPFESLVSIEEKEIMLDLIDAAMKELTDKQRMAIVMLFGLEGNEPISESKLAEKLQISQQSAHELKERALESLRKKIVPLKKDKNI